MSQKLHQLWSSKWLLSIISGIFLGLSFPPFPFPFLQFPAFVFVFRLISLSESAKDAAYHIYPGFLLWNLIGTYWLMLASLPAGMAAIIANAVLMALVVMLQFKAQQKLSNGWLIALFQTVFWVSFEYLHHQWDLSWPWLSLGNAWANATVVIQYISATGFLGISFWVIFTCALFHQARRLQTKSLCIGSFVVLALFPAVSLLQLPFSFPKSDTSVETVVAQPNFDSYRDYGGFNNPGQSLDMILNLSDSVRTPNTDLVVWPENAIHPYLSNRDFGMNYAKQAKERLKARAADWDATIIGGTAFFEFYDKDDPPALPIWRDENSPYLVFNAAMGFYPDSTTQLYRKHNLVTIVERFPFVHFFNAIDVFDWVNWAQIQNYGQGNRPNQFRAGSTKTTALICYDSVYPGWIRHFVQNGAGFITIITNDGWWGNTSGNKQHFAYARLRSIEFRRWVVRSANNGISGIIAPNGEVKKRTKYWTRTAFRYDVPVLTNQTFYARYGDWFPIGLLIIAIGGIGILLFTNQQAGREQNSL